MRIVYRITGSVCVLATILFAAASFAVLMKARWAYVDHFGFFLYGGISAVNVALAWLCFSIANVK